MSKRLSSSRHGSGGDQALRADAQAREALAAPTSPPSLLALLQLRDDTAKPMYQQLEDQLTAHIGDGTIPVGTVLPSERQLAERLGISRITVQRTYHGLRQRKLVSAQGRKGVLVSGTGPRLHPGMDRLKGFTEEMHELGKKPSSLILERRVANDRSIASIFSLPSPSPFLKLARVRFGDDVPLSHEVAWYNLSAAPALMDGDLSGSVYAFLNEHCGMPVLRCDQTIEAAAPTEEECGIFNIAELVPCLLIKRRSYTHGDLMIEYVEGLFRGDAYSYRLKLTV